MTLLTPPSFISHFQEKEPNVEQQGKSSDDDEIPTFQKQNKGS